MSIRRQPGADMMSSFSVSVVILTFNRIASLLDLLEDLRTCKDELLEIIVVDNASSDGTASAVAAQHPYVRLLTMSNNLGVGGRNAGYDAATADIIITLDDDLKGLRPADISKVRQRFVEDTTLGALNFKVIDDLTEQVCNWVHHRPISDADGRFLTYEITEGAVAMRREVISSSGGYAESFFISHEGPDLAFRLMDLGYDVAYDGSICIRHRHEQKERKPWRFYYYDTRNQFWVAARTMPAAYAARYLAIGIGAMLFYSIRDGFLLWWMRAVRDGLLGVPDCLRVRCPWTPRTRAMVAQIDSYRPRFMDLLKSRIFGKANRLDA